MGQTGQAGQRVWMGQVCCQLWVGSWSLALAVGRRGRAASRVVLLLVSRLQDLSHTHTHTHTCLLYTSPSPRD